MFQRSNAPMAGLALTLAVLARHGRSGRGGHRRRRRRPQQPGRHQRPRPGRSPRAATTTWTPVPGRDLVRGGPGNDVIRGGGGFSGRRGDLLHGNAGDDVRARQPRLRPDHRQRRQRRAPWRPGLRRRVRRPRRRPGARRRRAQLLPRASATGCTAARGTTGSPAVAAATGCRAAASDDVQTGGGGADLIFANRGADQSWGGEGADELWALSRYDVAMLGDPWATTSTARPAPTASASATERWTGCTAATASDSVLADQYDQVDTDCELVQARAGDLARPGRGRAGEPRPRTRPRTATRAEPDRGPRSNRRAATPVASPRR